jgi:hypothetical protein
MTKKVYRTAMGKTVDMGALLLQNENVRAVGNMGVNARGDTLDSDNRVIDQQNRQVQRQYRRQATNVTRGNVTDSLVQSTAAVEDTFQDTFDDLPDDNDVVIEKATDPTAPIQGGLAAAIARSRAVKQELEKPLTTKPTKVRKI